MIFGILEKFTLKVKNIETLGLLEGTQCTGINGIGVISVTTLPFRVKCRLTHIPKDLLKIDEQ